MLPLITVTAVKPASLFTTRIIFIHSIKASKKLGKIKSKLTLSKAFSKSISNIKPGKLLVFAC